MSGSHLLFPRLWWSWTFLGSRSTFSTSARSLCTPSFGWFPTRSAPRLVRSCAHSNRWRKNPRIVDHGEYLDLSAFLVVIWCTYRNKFSGLIRAIAADATVYFLAVVAAQVYIQTACVLMDVRSFARFPRYFLRVEYNHCRVFLLRSRSCECVLNLNDNGSELTISACA